MATIKLQPSGNVLIKDGKVSCGCCEGCCMYPAQGFVDGLYTADDLPDEIYIAGNLAQKQLTGFPRYLAPDIEGFTVTDPEELDSTWSVVIFGNTVFGLDCLISSFNQSAPLGIEDTFADTYSVSGTVSGTVTRTSICTWVGTGLTLSNFGFQFKVNGNNKSGFQNTPEGSYAGGFTVS